MSLSSAPINVPVSRVFIPQLYTAEFRSRLGKLTESRQSRQWETLNIWDATPNQGAILYSDALLQPPILHMMPIIPIRQQRYSYSLMSLRTSTAVAAPEYRDRWRESLAGCFPFRAQANGTYMARIEEVQSLPNCAAQ
jgi:hypothetical protein